jgi:hypothetical protein
MYGLILALHHDARFLRIPGSLDGPASALNAWSKRIAIRNHRQRWSHSTKRSIHSI